MPRNGASPLFPSGSRGNLKTIDSANQYQVSFECRVLLTFVAGICRVNREILQGKLIPKSEAIFFRSANAAVTPDVSLMMISTFCKRGIAHAGGCRRRKVRLRNQITRFTG